MCTAIDVLRFYRYSYTKAIILFISLSNDNIRMEIKEK